MTFGAPMVIQAHESALLYEQLEALDGFAQAQLPAGCRIQYHNFVNNADIVPRLLGSSLESVHGAVEAYIPSMKACFVLVLGHTHPNALKIGSLCCTFLDTKGPQQCLQRVRRIAQSYHPFGTYHLIMGASVRTLDTTTEARGHSRLGDAALAAEVTRQLSMNRIWKAVYGTSGK